MLFARFALISSAPPSKPSGIGAVASPNSYAFKINLETAARYISPGSFRKMNWMSAGCSGSGLNGC